MCIEDIDLPTFEQGWETVERQSSRSVSNGRILTHPLRHHIRHSVELFCCEVEM